jgi:hypothetical protein
MYRMNAPIPTRPASRMICSSIAVLLLVLILAWSQFGGGLAQPAPVPDAGSILTGQSFPGNNPGAMLYTPEGVFAGANGEVEFVSQLQDSFSNVQFDVRDTRSAGSLLVIEFTMTGIHDGMYMNNPPRCAGVSVDGLAVLELGDQGVERQWISYDRATLLAQIDAFSHISPDSRPTCESQGIVLDEQEPTAVSRPACVVANTCFMLP